MDKKAKLESERPKRQRRRKEKEKEKKKLDPRCENKLYITTALENWWRKKLNFCPWDWILGWHQEISSGKIHNSNRSIMQIAWRHWRGWGYWECSQNPKFVSFPYSSRFPDENKE